MIAKIKKQIDCQLDPRDLRLSEDSLQLNNKKNYLIAGIDEVRKGALFGDLEICLAMADQEQIKLLENDPDIKDSKLVTKYNRPIIFNRIAYLYKIKYEIITVKPSEIDLNNLNQLLLEKYSLFKSLKNCQKLIVDCPSNNLEKATRDLKDLLKINSKKELDLVIENRADEKYKIVSCASIIAKHLAEEKFKELNKKWNYKLGSGYPSDLITRKFYFENRDNPLFSDNIRKKWNISEN